MRRSTDRNTVCDSILDAIGSTPVVRLARLAARFGAGEVLAKLEFMNPSGSIKDRMALHMLREAERNGRLPANGGGRIVEASSGNTGIAFASIAAVKQHRFTVVVPASTAEEKCRRMQALGAELLKGGPNARDGDPEFYREKARRIAIADDEAFYPDQYNNDLNADAHYVLTAPELWEQLDGHIDTLVAGIGSGGTVSGLGRYLKERNPAIRVVAVEPEGSVFQRAKEYGEAGPTLYKTRVEGLGKQRPTQAADLSVIDEVVQVHDDEALYFMRQLAQYEGIFAGSSSGAVLAAAIRESRRRPSARIATIFPDTGLNYLSTTWAPMNADNRIDAVKEKVAA